MSIGYAHKRQYDIFGSQHVADQKVGVLPSAQAGLFLRDDGTWQTASGGTTGLQGVTGARGSTGPSGGDQGVTGQQGSQGVTGAQAVTGAQGYTGAQGHTGGFGEIGSLDSVNYYPMVYIPASSETGYGSLVSVGYTGSLGVTGAAFLMCANGAWDSMGGGNQLHMWIYVNGILVDSSRIFYYNTKQYYSSYWNWAWVCPPEIAGDTWWLRFDIQAYTGIEGPPTAGITGLWYASTISITPLLGAQGPTGLAGGGTGLQGITGLVGGQGNTGTPGVAGATGVAGTQGITGPSGGDQGVTGLQGPQGNTGIYGVTGPLGPTGLAGAWGFTGYSFTEYDAGTQTTAGIVVDFSNGFKQAVAIGVTGGQKDIGFKNGLEGMNGTLRISYLANESPGITGVLWPNGARPALSGYTGLEDIVSVYCDGTRYLAQAALAFSLA